MGTRLIIIIIEMPSLLALLRARPCLVARPFRVATRRLSDSWSALGTKASTVVDKLAIRGETVAVAETSSGGLISAAIWSSPSARVVFKGAGVRLAYGINREADKRGVEMARKFTKDSSDHPPGGW